MEFRNRFQETSPIVLNLIIINGLVFFAQMAFGGLSENQPSVINDLFALHHYKSNEFRPYQLITHMFMHGGFFHLLFNMLGLWMFGNVLEKVWGSKRFLLFFLICGFVAGVSQMLNYVADYYKIDRVLLDAETMEQYQLAMRLNCTIGASGGVMGILAAFGYLFPNTQLFIMPIPFPIKAKWAIMGIIALDIFGGVVNTANDNVAHFAHVGGALAGFLLVLYWNKTNRNTFF
jgi:membrane associated rhomboid family serine protease